MANTTISNGVITTDTLNVRANTTTGTLSVSGDASVTGSLSVNGTDITETIAGQSAKIDDHIANMNTATAPHMTVAEHEQFNKIAQLFADMEPYNSPLGYSSIDLPPEAIPPNYFPVLYAEKAQDNWLSIVAPGSVFGSRVPLAVTANGSITNDYSSIAEAVEDESGLYVDLDGVVVVEDKLWDNAGLQHTCSTDTTENQDDYTGMGPTLAGRKWAFYWEYGNYVKDQYGIKHVTAIKGVPANISIPKSSTETFTTSEFDITKNTCAFGPVFWFACVEDKSTTANFGNGQVPFNQLWVISDSPWDTIDASHPLYDGIVYAGLSDSIKGELQEHGITSADWHIWPECLVKDANGNDKIRPYWCHSAFALGAKSGTAELCSIAQLPLVNGLSFDALNNMAVNENGETYAASKCPGSATVNGFGTLFDVIKNATKDSQSIHSGFVSSPPSTLEATADYDNTDERHDSLGYYLFPANADVSTLQPGMSIRLTTSSLSVTDVNYGMDTTIQHARVKAVGTYDLTTGQPSDAGTMCIVIDKAAGTANPVMPFRVYTTANLPDPLPENTYVCCYASQSLSMAGETMLGGEEGGGVLHKHDGAVYLFLQSEDGTVGTHTYRVQGTEYSPGVSICAADTVAVRGDGSTVTIDGVDYTSTQYFILQCKIGKSRKVDNPNATITNWTANDLYKPIAIMPNITGVVINNVLSSTGVTCPTWTDPTSPPIGTRDGLYMGANPSGFLSGGLCYSGFFAGSSCLNLDAKLGRLDWSVSARD